MNPGGVLTPVTEALERYLTDVHDPDKAALWKRPFSA
jgi:hypothetical protein